ncbi:acyltransferase family protein [Sphaerisporangium fuscum]|uniref:acyltransferase family protein n=1 Tax=Sphaerisporangium fuscum TaxID=2835868 RepID=UPI001BDD5CF7|nr:acyltransferase [Sphaerisporangium fuscum]
MVVSEKAGNPGGGTPSTARRYFPQLEGMRGLAALGVLVLHVAFSATQMRWDENPGMEETGNGIFSVLLNQFQVSLPIFFTLSGMLLYRPFALATIVGTPKPAIKPYLWRRALRCLPAYWALTAVTLVLLNRDNIHGFWEVLRPVLLLQIYQNNAWVLGMEQTWSLATEIAFYFALPVIAWILHKIASGAATPAARVRRILISLSTVIPVSVAWTAWTHLPSFGAWPIEGNWPPGWIDYIATGMALAALSAAASVSWEHVPAAYRAADRRPLLCWAGALAAYLVACVSPFGDPGSANYPPLGQSIVEHLAYLVFGFLAVTPLTLPHLRSRFIEAVVTNRVMLFLGRISYGIYLWHIAIIYFWHGNLFRAGNFGVLLAVDLLGSIACATVSYYLIESPAMRLRERLGKATKDPSVAIVVPEPAPAPAEPAVSAKVQA